jgi:hypothetical protein
MLSAKINKKLLVDIIIRDPTVTSDMDKIVVITNKWGLSSLPDLAFKIELSPSSNSKDLLSSYSHIFIPCGVDKGL